MEKIDILRLQNGSDIRGVALAVTGGEDVNLTPRVVRSITGAFLGWLCDKTRKNADHLTLAAGYDSRISGPVIMDELSLQMRKLGAQVLDAGMASTPAMYMSTVFPEFSSDAAIMITASHLPGNRNGFKFFTRDGGLDKSDIREILNLAQALYEAEETKDDTSLHDDFRGGVKRIDLMDRYSRFLRDIITEEVGDSLSGNSTKPLLGLHVVVDAGNGAGGFYVDKVLKPLGADTGGSQYLDPDGNFPNHEPNPENKEAMASVKRAVTDNGGDLGLIFDTDVDRSSAVDSNGRDISRNAIVALAAALISDNHPGTTVVTDSITSAGLHDFLTEDLGLKHHRFKRGYRNVINESVRLNKEGVDSQLAIETSGHAAYKENAFLDDGAYLATRIVIKAARLKSENRGIESLISGLRAPAESEEFRFKIRTEEFSSYGDKVLADLKTWVSKQDGLSLAEPNYEGIRIDFDRESGSGWALLRKSLHDPIMVLNIESERKNGVKSMGKILLGFLSAYEELNISKLILYCN